MSQAISNLPRPIDGIIALGAELEWSDGAIVESNIDWESVRSCSRPAIALRIAPLPASRTIADLPIKLAISEARRLIAQAQQRGVALTELQLDFDCPASQLRGYASAVGALRAAIKPLPLVITVLPAWLDSSAFANVAANCDRFVLQVHSIPLHNGTGQWKLYDPALARKWIERAATYNKRFAVALPTYRCLAAYAPDGHLFGVIMDSVESRWPPDTRLYEIAANADDLADAIAEWRARRPENFCEVLWYRLPVVTDMRNWRTATLAAVANGRRPQRRLEVVGRGNNPVDIAVRNAGEADQLLSGKVLVRGNQPAADMDALEGWHIEHRGSDTIFVVNDGATLSLRPGETRNIGWVRLARPEKLDFQIIGAGL